MADFTPTINVECRLDPQRPGHVMMLQTTSEAGHQRLILHYKAIDDLIAVLLQLKADATSRWGE